MNHPILFDLREAARTDATVAAYLHAWERDQNHPDAPTRVEMLEALAAHLAHEKAELRRMLLDKVSMAPPIPLTGIRTPDGGYVIRSAPFEGEKP